MLKRTALAALVLAGFASGALAQTQPSQPTQPSQSSSSNFGTMPWSPMGAYDNTNNQAKLWRQSMNEDGHSNVSQDQWRRAREAVALIKANRCEDAYNLALTEQDYRLAGNVAAACKAHVRE